MGSLVFTPALHQEETKAELHLEPAERLSLPEQAFHPAGLQRERHLCVSEGALKLLHPFIAQGTVPKQPGAKTREVTLSGSSAEGRQGPVSYLNSFGSYLMASVKHWTAVSNCPDPAKRHPIPEPESKFTHLKLSAQLFRISLTKKKKKKSLKVLTSKFSASFLALLCSRTTWVLFETRFKRVFSQSWGGFSLS